MAVEMHQRNDFHIVRDINNSESGEPRDMRGNTIVWTLKRSISDQNYVLQKSTANGTITITAGDHGIYNKITVIILSADTNELTGEFIWDLVQTTPGNRATIQKDTLTIFPAVTP